MLEVKIKEEIESRCGIECSKCEFQDTMNCKGCINIDKPFYGECAVKTCVENKGLGCCGECSDFPCELLNSYAYDKEHGDNGARIKNCARWCQKSKEQK